MVEQYKIWGSVVMLLLLPLFVYGVYFLTGKFFQDSDDKLKALLKKIAHISMSLIGGFSILFVIYIVILVYVLSKSESIVLDKNVEIKKGGSYRKVFNPEMNMYLNYARLILVFKKGFDVKKIKHPGDEEGIDLKGALITNNDKKILLLSSPSDDENKIVMQMWEDIPDDWEVKIEPDDLKIRNNILKIKEIKLWSDQKLEIKKVIFVQHNMLGGRLSRSPEPTGYVIFCPYQGLARAFISLSNEEVRGNPVPLSCNDTSVPTEWRRWSIRMVHVSPTWKKTATATLPIRRAQTGHPQTML